MNVEGVIAGHADTLDRAAAGRLAGTRYADTATAAAAWLRQQPTNGHTANLARTLAATVHHGGTLPRSYLSPEAEEFAQALASVGWLCLAVSRQRYELTRPG